MNHYRDTVEMVSFMSWFKYLIHLKTLTEYLWDSVDSVTFAPPSGSKPAPTDILGEECVKIWSKELYRCRERQKDRLYVISWSYENTVYWVNVNFHSIVHHISSLVFDKWRPNLLAHSHRTLKSKQLDSIIWTNISSAKLELFSVIWSDKI